MSFQAIVGGSDCGPSNPLQNLIKRTEHLPISSSSRFEQLDQSDQGPSYRNPSNSHQHDPTSGLIRSNTSFLMNDIKNELESVNRTAYSSHHLVDQPWQKQSIASLSGPSLSLHEMAQMDRSFRPLVNQQTNYDWTQEFVDNREQVQNPSDSLSRMNHVSTSQGLITPSLFAANRTLFPQQGLFNHNRSFFPQSGICPTTTPTQKSRTQTVELTEENWEAAFAQIGNQLQIQPGGDQNSLDSSKINQSTSTSTDLESPLSQTQESTDEDLEADAEFLKSLEATWKGLANNLNSGSLSLPSSNWEDFTEDDFLGAALTSHPTNTITPENVGDFLENPEPYPFQSNNPFADHPDPFQEGLRLIQSGATLSEAALAFEAACRLNESRSESWRMLGETQAADEKEQLAIKAFQKAVECQEVDGQSSWMSLAICWVNEGQEMRALAILERWLTNAYPAIASNSSLNSIPEEEKNNPWANHKRVVDKFLQAARAGPAVREGVGKDNVRNQVVDVDVQVGLGVLFYSNSEYDRARDCFEAALGVNPSDFLLWNRLGAALANGGKSEEAIGAYQKALELRPTFTRAIYNLGVSCLNIHCYKEAVEHFLAALSLHAKAASVGDRPLLPDGDGSENLWLTLRRGLLCLDRSDLADLAVPKTDIEIFRQHGFDF